MTWHSFTYKFFFCPLCLFFSGLLTNRLFSTAIACTPSGSPFVPLVAITLNLISSRYQNEKIKLAVYIAVNIAACIMSMNCTRTRSMHLIELCNCARDTLAPRWPMLSTAYVRQHGGPLQLCPSFLVVLLSNFCVSTILAGPRGLVVATPTYRRMVFRRNWLCMHHEVAGRTRGQPSLIGNQNTSIK